ncbi:MAG TPA: DinB family protein [Gemmatimonadaceae bacterium]|nr:DinB family protein [Gemmatimonadaceae bacterium]
MRIAAALFALSVAASFVEAQQPAAPPTTATVFRNRTGALRKQIVQALDSIPESKFSYKPTPAQLTVGFVAQHVASDSYFFCSNFSDKKPTVPDEEAKAPDSVKAAWPKAKLMASLRAAVAYCDDVMTSLDDTNIGAIITVAGQNNTTRQASRMQYVLGHALDLQDHYSQLANYMRLNGILPPTALPRPGRGGN